MRNIAVILAAGSGSRAGGGIPKQFRLLANGNSVIETCIDAFRQCEMIDEIRVVLSPEHIHNKAAIPERLRNAEDIIWVEGGKERWESSWRAIQSITQEANILIHDCARPFVSQSILKNTCDALTQHEAVSVAIPATDTMYQVSNEQIEQIPQRRTMYRAQTPQAFRLSLVRKAYEIALADGELEATDDCGIVHKYIPETPIFIVPGEEANKKITFKEDFA